MDWAILLSDYERQDRDERNLRIFRAKEPDSRR